MIAFGTYIGEPEPYRRYTEPGIRLVAEADSAVFPFAVVGQVGRTYNLIMEKAAEHDDLEAVVLMHPHTELVDPDFCSKVREALSCPAVAVAGCIGATGVRTLAWWHGQVNCGPVRQRYNEYGSGEVPAFSWANPDLAPAEVEVVDGFLMVVSPWAARNLCFDEELIFGYGFDFDFCMQVREEGRKVVTAPFEVIQHRALDVIPEDDVDIWIQAHAQIADKWERRMPGAVAPGGGVDWKPRARRAEAEREAARAFAHGHLLGADAQSLHLERALEKLESSFSWRVTEPLRRANVAAKRLRARRS